MFKAATDIAATNKARANRAAAAAIIYRDVVHCLEH
jgi:hypothetical protein